MNARWSLSLFLVSSVLACGKEDPPPDAQAGLTYWQDVAPLYYENCVACHQPGGIAPFRLDRYQDAKTWALPAKQAVEARTMPPWLVTADGSCGEFHDSRWLDDAAIEKISRWAADGAVEGTPRSDLQVPTKPGITGARSFQTPRFVPEIQGGAFAEFDEYRCFLIDPRSTEDQFITGYEILPGDPSIVHHVLAMPVDPDQVIGPGMTNMQAMTMLDQESPDRDGWPCFGLAGDGVAVDGVPVTWAPGMGAVEYPQGTGVHMAKNRLLVLQVHYNLSDPQVRGRSDSTELRLRLAPQVERVGFFVLPDLFLNTLFEGEPAALEPGKEAIDYTWTENFDEELAGLGVDHVEVYGVMPHMHERGRKLKLEIGAPDSMACAADVQSWDFGWQFFYFYEQPFEIRAGTQVRVTCTFDTRGKTEPVLPGWGTQNEMCLTALYVVLPANNQP